MTSALYVTAANSMLAVLEGYEYIQLHTGSPGAAGTSNIAAESTRFLVEWDAPSGGSVQILSTVTITTVAATETWTNFTAWSASSGGTVGLRGEVNVGQVISGSDVDLAPESITVTFPLAS
jgi:hypothetical protein